MKYTLALLALVANVLSEDIHFETIVGGKSGSAETSRYWDCCKPSCAWKENIKTHDMQAVLSCTKDGESGISKSVKSGCDGGDAYMCTNQHPWIVNSTIGYGFASASFIGGVDDNLCCACFKMNFTDPQLLGKSLVVQVTNIGENLGTNHFDFAIPGGGVGLLNQGCHNQWNAPWNGWGDQYSGIKSREECFSLLPGDLVPGCVFRFDFMKNVDNPRVNFNQVRCPKQIVQRSGCHLDL